MGRSGQDHLSDLEIASLISGRSSRALHQALAEHLAACDECRELLARSAVANRADPQGSATQGGPVTVPIDSILLEAMLGALAGRVTPTVANPALPLAVDLRAVGPAWPDEDLVLAARSSPAAALPTLASDDGSIVVHFRRPNPAASLRAYVVRKAPAAPGSLWLVFRGTGRAFAVGADGEADLPDVSEGELGQGRVQIELRPMGTEAS
jgi:hypothetical protein